MILSTTALSYIALASVITAQKETTTEWVMDSYGSDMEFIIKRNGKKVGNHSVSFNDFDEQIVVQSNTSIQVKFLFFTAYSFKYEAEETWINDKLISVESRTKDGGDEFALNKIFDADGFIFPTNHWNPAVLEENAVYNTITGKTNLVSIQPDAWEMLPTGNGDRKAMRYDYTGDLKDVSAWYDEQGRWVALRFKAKDGSTITYECTRCGV